MPRSLQRCRLCLESIFSNRHSSGKYFSYSIRGKLQFLKTIPNFFIVNLAISDILASFLVIPIYTLFYYHHVNIKMCDIIFSCPVIPLVSSLTFLVMIALDRTVCIAKPFWYQRHAIMRRAVLLTVTCWLFTILSPFLPLLAPYEANGDFCYPEDRVFSPANVKVGVVLFAGYAFMMTGLYFAISHIARKQARRIAVQTHSADVSIQNEAKVRNMLWRYSQGWNEH